MKQTEHALGIRIAPTPDGADDTTSYRAYINLAVADLALNNIIEMGPLPAGTELVDAILDSDDLDSNGAPTLTFDVGVMSGNVGDLTNPDGSARTIDASIMSGVNVAQTGGVARPTLASAFRITRSPVDRSIGLKVRAAGATPQAGTIGLTLIYRG
ncbi:hypothetical protein [Bradyrhizobium sp. SZCCHNS1012]|uniref:hypothetical protein n=1 Tax=Bradyrhizobium sp. SZCCHNS1012 TaxID=3057297 RepID=UPI0029162039|nr:hypothetical protein [Bradyrhizobium sp. SZCCHNS1012]